eukprot:g4110.t1
MSYYCDGGGSSSYRRRPGDWDCPSCGKICSATSVECNHCHTPKLFKPVGTGGGYQGATVVQETERLSEPARRWAKLRQNLRLAALMSISQHKHEQEALEKPQEPEGASGGYSGGGGGGSQGGSGYSGGAYGGRSGYTRCPGDWDCSSCGEVCFASIDECNRCLTPKPPQGENAGGGCEGGGGRDCSTDSRCNTAKKSRCEMSDQGVGKSGGDVEPASHGTQSTSPSRHAVHGMAPIVQDIEPLHDRRNRGPAEIRPAFAYHGAEEGGGVEHTDVGVTGIPATPLGQLLSPTTASRARREVAESAAGTESPLAGCGVGVMGADDVAKSASESAHTTLIAQFDSFPATYAAEDAGVRLHVRAGSMAEGQVAGPIIIQTDKRLLVKCGGSSFVVSALVDCQPSGSTFDVPLDLDFLVEDELDEQSDDSSDAGRDDFFNECKEMIRNAYKVLQRQQSGDPWDILSDEETTIVVEDGVFFLRAKYRHFTEGCLAKTVVLDNAVQTETTKIGRPRKKQLEFINATNKTLTFLVLPTTWSNKDIKSLAVSVGVEEMVEAKVSIDRVMKQAVLRGHA